MCCNVGKIQRITVASKVVSRICVIVTLVDDLGSH